MERATAPPPADRREPGELFGAGFTLFADMLVLSLATTVASLPVVTAPAAFAAASATLRDSAVDGAAVTARGYLRRLRARLTGRFLAAGLLPPLLLVVVLVDAALVHSALPGAALVAPALALTVLGAAVAGLRAAVAGLRAIALDTRLPLRAGVRRSLADPRGSALLAAGVLLAALLAWAIPLLVPLLAGPLALAAAAVEHRHGGARTAA
ncbi:hypothetical protein ACFV2E_20250 [Streptomyces globisporus]|uniref:hypothetical protein n=1 Tax=Streptomyces globisporus TaxID=1908 RepID=UPI0036C9088B